MYDVSEKFVFNFMCALFLLRCSNAFYNLKVYIIQNEEGREKNEKMQKIVPLFIMMLYNF